MLLSAPPPWAELGYSVWAGLLPGLTDSGQITPRRTAWSASTGSACPSPYAG